VIFAGKFMDRQALYSVDGLYYLAPTEDFAPPYYACTPKQDCEYLTKFFSGEKVEPVKKYHLRDDQFYIYIPFVGKETRYVLLFRRENSYRKIGS